MEQEYNRPKRNSNRGKASMNTNVKDRLEAYIERTYPADERVVKDKQHVDYIRSNLL